MAPTNSEPQPSPNRYTQAQCPRCGATTFITRAKGYSIVWDDPQRRFVVQLMFDCTSCGTFTEKQLKTMSLDILKTSICPKGHKLSLANNKIERDGDDIRFTGTYPCKICNTRKRVVLRNIIGGLRKIWEDTTSVEIGLKGIKYKKK